MDPSPENKVAEDWLSYENWVQKKAITRLQIWDAALAAAADRRREYLAAIETYMMRAPYRADSFGTASGLSAYTSGNSFSSGFFHETNVSSAYPAGYYNP